MPAGSSARTPAPEALRPSRAKRRLVHAALALVGLVLAGLFYLTRPSTLASIILPAASRAIGGDVTATRLWLEGLDTIVVKDLRIRVRTWTGDAGEVVRIETARLEFSLWSLLLGDVDIRSIDIDSFKLRLAERGEAPGDFSLLAFVPATDDDTKSRRQRPARISIGELAIEHGVQTDDGYEVLGAVRFAGSIVPDASAPAAFSFGLTGIGDLDGRRAIASLKGSFDPDARALAVELLDLSLDPDHLGVVPIALRASTERLGLVGRIPLARLSYTPEAGPTAELDVEGLAMDLPIEAFGGPDARRDWVGFAGGEEVEIDAAPRMTIREGTLRIEGDRLSLEGLRGELGSREAGRPVLALPFECDFSAQLPRAQLDAFDWDGRESWLEEASRLAPFTLSLTVRGFSSAAADEERAGGETGAPMLVLPRAAVKVLADFNITAWEIDVETLLSRDAPTADGRAGELRSSGTLALSRGSGAFDQFRYRLDDVQGLIRFEGDNVVVERLTGLGGDGASASITGTLVGIATGAEIDLRVECADAPIDARLFEAFEPGPRDALDLLFDARAAGNLEAANLLPDAALLVTQRHALAQLGDDPLRAAARARLERSIAAGPFALGGRCGFSMRVYSPAGFGQPVFVTGSVEVRSAGLLFGRFPYPLRIERGTFTVLDEAIVIGGGGIEATTPAGGRFTISGSVQIPRDGSGGRGVRPLIQIADENDALNPALLAAIPHASDSVPQGWPGAALAPAGELLRALGLSGALDMTGIVTSRPDGTEDFRVRLALADGRAEPDADGRAWLSREGLPWPDDFALEACTARVDITPERVQFDQCIGRRGAGTVVARGHADLAGPERVVELELNDLPLDRAFEDFLSGDEREAEARFRRLEPSGVVDGVIRRTVDAAGAVTKGMLTPKRIEILLDGARVSAERIAGRVAVDGLSLRAESLEFRLASGGQPDGMLRLSGPLSADELDARISGARFESPLLRGVLSTRSAALVSLLRARGVRGVYDARYTARGGERLELSPRALELGEDGARLGIAFDAESRIVADGDSVEIDLRGALASGASGSVNLRGTVDLASAPVLAAQYTLDAAALTPALRAGLPPPLDDAARAIALESTGRFLLDLPAIDLRIAEPSQPAAAASAEGASEVDVALYALGGALRVEDAAFDAGTRVTGLTGELPIAFRYEPLAAESVRFRTALSASRATVLGRAVGRTRATIASRDNGRAISIKAEGDLAGGRFDIASTLDRELNRYDMRLRIADADYERLREPGSSSRPGEGGRVSGFLSLGGPMGSAGNGAQREGTARVSVRDATIASTPIAMRALQLTQLMLPINSALQRTDAEARIRGDTAEIVSARLSSGTLELTGTGTMDIPTMSVAMRLYPKGTVPIVSDLIGGLTRAIFAIDVSGPLGDPKVSLAPLPGITEVPEVPAVPEVPEVRAVPEARVPLPADAAPQTPDPSQKPLP
jgi:hypothetical protein